MGVSIEWGFTTCIPLPKIQLRNGVEITLHFWVAYFVPSFFFKIGSYVDIMTDFKGENRDKRSYPKM